MKTSTIVSIRILKQQLPCQFEQNYKDNEIMNKNANTIEEQDYVFSRHVRKRKQEASSSNTYILNRHVWSTVKRGTLLYYLHHPSRK